MGPPLFVRGSITRKLLCFCWTFPVWCQTLVVPVTLTVHPVPPLTVNPSSLSFAHTLGFTQNPGAQPLNVTTTNGSGQATPAAFTVSQTSLNASTPATLLSIGATSGTTTGTAAPVAVSISYNRTVAESLPPGTYGGSITLAVAGVTTNPQSTAIPWILVISSLPVIQATPSTVTFDPVPLGSTSPATRQVSLNSSPGVSYTVSAVSSPNWLSVSPASGTSSNSPITVTALPVVGGTPLAAGTYTGSIVVTAAGAGNSPMSIPVTYTIQAPTITASPAAVLFAVAANATSQQPVNFSSNGAASSFTASAASVPSGWLSVTPSGSTAAPATVTVNTAGLAANSTYSGSLQFVFAGAANSPVTVPVTLTVGSPALCTFSLSATSFPLSSNGTSSNGLYPSNPQSVTVTTGAACNSLSWTAVSSDPAWLTLVSGAGGTGNGVVTFNAFSNPRSTARSGAITISAPGAPSATIAVTEAASVDPLQPRQVRALYQSILRREPDSDGFTFWSGAGQSGLGTMADDFMTSSENVNNAAQTLAIYQGVLGRFPTVAEFLASPIHAESIQASGAALTLVDQLSKATEFLSHYGPPTAANVVNVLYGNLLQRAPSPAESSASAFVAYSNIYTGAEYRNLANPPGSDHSNRLYVTMLYLEILGRGPDASGLNFWFNIAGSGGPGIFFQPKPNGTRKAMLGPGAPGSGFIGSAEFQQLFQ